MTGDVRRAYAGSAAAWANDASLAYRPLAVHLVATCPVELANRLALDAGAGTGVATEALTARGAIVIAADIDHGMVAATRPTGVPIVADVHALPIASATFEVSVAAFVLNHLEDPAGGLAEIGHVTRPGGAILASTFSVDRAAAKGAVDAVARRFGWEQPPWYAEFHRRAEGVGTVDLMVAVARRAGLDVIDVADTDVDVGLDDPALVVRYRLGMPQLAPFAMAMTDDERAAFIDECVAAVASTGERFRPAVIELVARRPRG